MVAEIQSDYDSSWQAMRVVAEKLGIGSTETVRLWVRQAEVDGGTKPGTTTEESEELKRLRRENSELRRANDILKAASAFFAAEIDRPHRRS
jgi:transposase